MNKDPLNILWLKIFTDELKMKWNELIKKKTQPTDVCSEFSYKPAVWTGSEFWDGPAPKNKLPSVILANGQRSRHNRRSDRTGELKRVQPEEH